MILIKLKKKKKEPKSATKTSCRFLWVAMYPENILLYCSHSCVFRTVGAHSLSMKISWSRGLGRTSSDESAEIMSTAMSTQ